MDTATIMDMMFNTEMIVKDMNGGKEDMTEKRFTIKEFSTLDAMSSLDVICDEGIELPSSTACDLLNELYEENEHYKSIFFELVETALTDKNCRELYCKGVLGIFDEANSLNQARDMIKEFLE